MMRILGLITILFCFACGGMLPEKKVTRLPASIATPVPFEQHQCLSLLETKYQSEKKELKLSIVRGMILKLEEKYPELKHTSDKASPDELRKGVGYRSLELSVEHLSHREAVKFHTRHSAFHTRP